MPPIGIFFPKQEINDEVLTLIPALHNRRKEKIISESNPEELKICFILEISIITKGPFFYLYDFLINKNTFKELILNRYL